MHESITSIPINDIFEHKKGCPICRMRDMLEQRVIKYILGAAMMEPDIRIETNKKGFCFMHYSQMIKQNNHLSLALMLDSYLSELENEMFSGTDFFGVKYKKQLKIADEKTNTCFVCEKINGAMKRMIVNCCNLWENEKEFKNLFDSQEYICLEHFKLLRDISEKEISKKNRKDFNKAVSVLTEKHLNELRNDILHFCEMYDYHNNVENADWGSSKDSVERTIEFLTSRKIF